MAGRKSICLYLLLIVLFLLAGCNSEQPVEPLLPPELADGGEIEVSIQVSNPAPLVGQTVTLDGSASTASCIAGNETITYTWSFEDRPDSSSAQMINPNSQVMSFTPDVPGVYIFGFSIELNCPPDTLLNTNLFSAEIVGFTAGTDPIADAGPDRMVDLMPVTLDGSASIDPLNRQLSYEWQVIEYPASSIPLLVNQFSEIATLVVTEPGTYTVELYVFIDQFDNDRDTMQVIINPPVITSFQPPSGPVGTTVTISGRNFSNRDADGNTVTFDGITADISSASDSQLVVTVPDNAATGPIEVTVTENNQSGSSSTDFVVTVSSGSWNVVATVGTDITGISFGDDLNGLVVGRNGLALRTSDGGLTWSSPLNTGTTNILFAVSLRSSGIGYAVGTLGTILKTTNNGNDWTSIDGGTMLSLYGVTTPDDMTVYTAGSSDNIFKSTDGGTNWENVGSSFPHTASDIHFFNSQQGVVVDIGSRIQITVDGGQNWTTAWQQNGPPWLQAVDFTGTNVGTTVSSHPTAGQVFRTTDGGNNWFEQSNGVEGNFTDVSMATMDAVFAVGENGIILRTTDGGLTWEAEESGQNIRFDAVHAINADVAIAAGQNGIILRRE